MTETRSNVPRWFKPVAVLALVWNLLGCAAYLTDVTITPADLAKMSSEQRALYEARPAWGVAGTALAVWGGALGSLGLLLRKRWSLPVLVVSLVGVIVQDIAMFVVTRAGAQAGPVAWVLQTIVLLVAIALVLLARRAIRSGWMTGATRS